MIAATILARSQRLYLLLFGLLAATGFSVLVLTLTAIPVLAQSNSPGGTLDANTLPPKCETNCSGYGFSSQSEFAQTFTAVRNGRLTSVQAHITRYGLTNVDLTLKVAPVDSSGAIGVPISGASAPVIASTVPISASANQLVTVNFDTPPKVEAGQKYALIASTPANSPPSSSEFAWWLSEQRYSSGTTMSSNRSVGLWSELNVSRDFLFAVYVSPDVVAPSTTATLSPQANANGFHYKNVTVTLEAKDGEGGSGVKGITYKIGSSQPETVTGNSATVQVREEGTTTISYYSKDNAGNVEEEKKITVKIDSKRPETAITTPQDGIEYFTGDEVIADYNCTDEEGGSGIENCTAEMTDGAAVDSGDTINTSEVGIYTLTVTASDKAGNESTKQATYYVAEPPDTTPPGEVTDFGATAGNKSAALAWTNPTDEDFDVVRILRSTEGATTDPRGEDYIYEGKAETFDDTGLTNGAKYTYTIFTRDTTGNWSNGTTTEATPDRSNVEITLGNLTQTYDGTPKAPTASTNIEGLSVDFTYTDEDGDLVENPINAGTYSVTATMDDEDYSGSKNADFIIVKAPLTVTVENATRKYGEDNPAFSANYSGFVDGEDANELGGTLTFDTEAGETSAPGEYPVTPGGLTSGNYQISFSPGTLKVVKATAAITLSGLDRSYDGTPKYATVATTPAGLEVVISYSRNGETVEEPTEVGRYDVRAEIEDTDYEGIQSAVLRITDPAPETIITSGPEGPTLANTLTFRYTGEDAQSPASSLVYSYRLNGGAWSAYSPGTAVPGLQRLPDGPYTFQVRAKDPDGNTDPTPAERRFVVDTVRPTGSLSLVENSFDRQTRTVGVNLTASDPGGTGVGEMRLKSDNEAWSNWQPFSATQSVKLIAKPGSTAIVYVQYRDHAGNPSTAYYKTMRIPR